jgi:broad specificity phosphatase PhoE
MSNLRHIVLVRHGETVGNSSSRFHGRNDVALSDHGRGQMRAVTFQLRHEAFGRVLASPLSRSWEAAWIVSSGGPVTLDAGLREIDFGRWEGLTKAEIEAGDPVLYADWQNASSDFVFPEGDSRAAFRARVEASLADLAASGVASALLVAHKGTVRVIAEKLLGEALPAGEPELAGVVVLSCGADGKWFRGRHGAEAPSPEERAA